MEEDEDAVDKSESEDDDDGGVELKFITKAPKEEVVAKKFPKGDDDVSAYERNTLVYTFFSYDSLI